jgi:sugar phosphate isomerase/epimerase
VVNRFSGTIIAAAAKATLFAGKLTMKFMMFAKHLQTLPLADAGRRVRGLGFEGLDLTLRPGGYVEPDRLRNELPCAIATLRDCGLVVPLLTTSITSTSDPAAAPTFEVAASLGVREIKLGYWNYKTFGTYRATLEQIARDLDGIEKLAEKSGVRANLHIHSGDHMTAQAPVVWQLIKDRNPRAIGAYADPGHMAIEGGRDGWRQGLDLLGDRIALVAIKDLRWEQVDDPMLGKPRWISRIVPLRQGIVRWPQVFACLRKVGFDGWVSMHSEYQGWHSWRNLTVDEVLDQTRDDLQFLQRSMARVDEQAIDRLTEPTNDRSPNQRD